MADKTPPNSSGTSAPEMTVEELQEAFGRGEIELPRPQDPTIESQFTTQNLEKFILGEITWAELQGMTVKDAYAFAEYGYRQFKEGRYHEAGQIFEALVVCNPYDAYFHTMLGACLQMIDEKDAAIDEYTSAVELDDHQLQAYVNRGELLLQKGQFEAALKDLKRATELDPTGQDPAAVRARALAAATAQAINDLADFIEKQKNAKI